MSEPTTRGRGASSPKNEPRRSARNLLDLFARREERPQYGLKPSTVIGMFGAF
jgi:hypothetical protein